MIIAFYILATVAILGAVMAITLRNVVHSVFCVLLFFSALAGLFLLLLAEFIAAVQVLVYIGSVGILMLFAIMLTTKVMGDSTRTVHSRGWAWGGLAVGRCCWECFCRSSHKPVPIPHLCSPISIRR